MLRYPLIFKAGYIVSSLRKTSHKLLKSINQQKVLHLIFSKGSISRVELN